MEAEAGAVRAASSPAISHRLGWLKTTGSGGLQMEARYQQGLSVSKSWRTAPVRVLSAPGPCWRAWCLLVCRHSPVVSSLILCVFSSSYKITSHAHFMWSQLNSVPFVGDTTSGKCLDSTSAHKELWSIGHPLVPTVTAGDGSHRCCPGVSA